ncbi:MAG: metallopeptidase TldD-related protein [Bacteroidia bacterium]|nr:metallopeptidase TldD-related protein [Bacteroidia bacterium]
MKNLKIYLVPVLFAAGYSLSAQDTGKAIHQAMEQEISRNMQNLHLAGMKDPFYIGLNVVDVNMLAINSSMGALVKITESPNRYTFNNAVLVGDYNSNNLNYTDPRAATYYLRTAGSLPLDNSVSEIQRKLWLSFDRAYKLSAENYESKQSALKSGTQTDDVAGLPDFEPGEKILIEKPEISLRFNNEALIKYANEISLALKSYRFLSNSWVKITGYKANIYYSNSEGSKATYPAFILRLVVNIETYAPNGELLESYKAWHFLNEADLPAKELVIMDAQSMAEALNELKSAPVFDDVYIGPVLFEDQAASEAVRKTMFYAKNENLLAFRKPVMGGPAGAQSTQNRTPLDDRIDKKVSHEDLNVKARPALTEYNGIHLIGSYPVDMDGSIPPQEVVLIENGILKNLLCGRTPTARMKISNGHLRVPFDMPNPLIVPGVIEVGFNNGLSKEDLKKKLLEMAQSEGLDYAMIIREMTPNQSEPRRVYKVDVKTGKEELVRSVGFKGLIFNDLRKIIGAGNQKIVMNTTAGEDLQHKFDYVTGCPATFITPDAFLFKDIEISKSTKSILTKSPIVKNPLEL